MSRRPTDATALPSVGPARRRHRGWVAVATTVVALVAEWGGAGAPGAQPAPEPAPVVEPGPAPVTDPATEAGPPVVDVRPEPLPPPQPVRLMALGDSITHGYTTAAGYRLRLRDRLTGAGWAVDLVGSLEHGPPGFEDAQHEGHGGYRIDRIRAGVPAWVGAARPDAVLVMAGTNDILGNFDRPNAPARLAALVDAIASAAPTASVLVASVPPITDPGCGCGAAVDAYNAGVRVVVADKAAAGYPVSFVDMSDVTAADLPDGIHPDETGQAKIAEAWFRALEQVPRGPRAPGPAPVPPRPGYWLAGADGGVFALGRARFQGGATSLRLNRPVVGIAPTPSGRGYWLVAADGAVLAFGDARFHGSAAGYRLNRPIVGIAAMPTGRGYWLVAADGGLFSFGDARFFGSTGAFALRRPIVGMAATPSGGGYWLVAADGGVFAFGDARFAGSTGATRLNRPIVAMAPTPTGLGYWLAGADGGVFAFGDARFRGAGPAPAAASVVGIAAGAGGSGYVLATAAGTLLPFGDAAPDGPRAVLVRSPVVGVGAPAP